MDDDIDLSLDEIIKKRKISAGGRPVPGGRGGYAGGGGIHTGNGGGYAGGGGYVGGGAGRKYKKIGGPRGGGAAGAGPYRGENYSRDARAKGYPMMDVRNKIIRNKRSKIRDARDHLIEQVRGRDARYRLDNRARQHYHQLHARQYHHPYHGGMHQRGSLPVRDALAALSTNGGYRGGYGVGADYLHPIASHPGAARYVEEYVPAGIGSAPMVQYQPSIRFPPMDLDQDEEDDDTEDDDDEEDQIHGLLEMDRVALGKTMSTLPNDAYGSMPATMPPLPQFRTVRASSNGGTTSSGGAASTSNGPPSLYAGSRSSSNAAAPSEPDPFDHYEVNRRPNFSVPPPPLPPASSRPLRGILRSSRPSSSPPPTASGSVSANLSPSMRARLERAPNPNASMGIFAHSGGNTPIRSYTSTRSPSPPSPPRRTDMYRIVVSNLHPGVTQIDIKELFEDIGDLLESRLVRPGVAEVIYSNMKDAERAVEAYHNRQLDGQPMNCLLVNPRPTYKPTATVSSAYGR